MTAKKPGPRTDMLNESPSEDAESYRVSKPQVLALEERHDGLLAATRLLGGAGYDVQVLFEESRITAKVLAAPDGHFLLLTARDTSRPLRVPQVIASLRGSGYDRLIAYCLRGRVSPETRSAYEALSVNRVLSLPMATRSSVLDALAWLHERVALHDGGVTILEV